MGIFPRSAGGASAAPLTRRCYAQQIVDLPSLVGLTPSLRGATHTEVNKSPARNPLAPLCKGSWIAEGKTEGLSSLYNIGM